MVLRCRPISASAMVLEVVEVTCINKTGIIQIGKDTMSIGGVLDVFEGSELKPIQIDSIKLGHFDTGTTIDYSKQPLELATFDFIPGTVFPKTIGAKITISSENLDKFVKDVVSIIIKLSCGVLAGKIPTVGQDTVKSVNEHVDTEISRMLTSDGYKAESLKSYIIDTYENASSGEAEIFKIKELMFENQKGKGHYKIKLQWRYEPDSEMQGTSL